MDENRQEAVYLVDRASLLHLKEAQGGGFDYTVFDKQTRERTAEGNIRADTIWEKIDPTRDLLAAAKALAIREAGLDGIETARVGLTSLKEFPTSDIRRRAVWEPETLPKNDIRVIDSSYNEQFRIPDGGYIQVTYPDRAFSLKCEHIDDYHAYYGNEVYHICQFAEIVERGGGTVQPEPEMDAEQAAWKLGWRNYLAVEAADGGWDYSIFDDKFDLVDGGALEKPETSIQEARNEILAAHKMEHRSMTPTDHGLLMDKAAQREQETRAEKRESVLGQLSALKAGAKEQAAPAPAKKRDEVSL